MQIVIIGCRSLDRVGGIESYMLDLCTCLAEKGHEIILYAGANSDSVQNLNNFTVKNIKVTSNKYLNKILIGLKSTKRAMKEYPNADIYHFNANVAGFFSFIPLLKHKNVVFHGHGFEWKRVKWNPVVRFCNKMLDNFVLSINKNILMCSQEQVDYVKANFKNKNIMFAPGGVSYSHFERRDIKNSYILFLGRIVAEKRMDLLLKAFTQIKDSISQDLYIAGPVEDEAIVAGYRSDNRIHFLGSKFGEEKAELLRNAFLYVLPSDLEGLSIALLEAMSYGNLCLVSDIDANKEALNDCGIYFRAGDLENLKEKLSDICLNPQAYETYKTKAVERIKSTFEWHIISDKIISYYETVVKKNNSKEN